MREACSMECSECKSRNYRTSRETRVTAKLELKKYCRVCRKHTVHKDRRR